MHRKKKRKKSKKQLFRRAVKSYIAALNVDIDAKEHSFGFEAGQKMESRHISSFKDFYLNENLPMGNEPIQVSIDWVLQARDGHIIAIPDGTELPKELEVGDVLSVIDNKFTEQYRAVVSGDRLTQQRNTRMYPIKKLDSDGGMSAESIHQEQENTDIAKTTYYAEFIERDMKDGAIMVKVLRSPPTGSVTELDVTNVKVSPLGKPWYLINAKRGDGRHRHGTLRLTHDSIVSFKW